MIWDEVEKKYGKNISNKMKKSRYLCGVTCTVREDGVFDFPERDIELAYKDVIGKPILEGEWD